MTDKEIKTEPKFWKDEFGRTLKPEDYEDYNPVGSFLWGIFLVVGFTILCVRSSVREDSTGVEPWDFSVFFVRHILHNHILWLSLITAAIIVFFMHRTLLRHFKLMRQQVQKEKKAESVKRFDAE